MQPEISSDSARLDIPLIHNFLSEQAYWCKGIPLETVVKAIENSLCFGIYLSQSQIGFARMITDKATYAYLADVFILPEHRGKGFSKQLMEFIMNYPDLQGLRRIALMTNDAHGLYKQFGFASSTMFDRYMEINWPGIYQRT